MKRAGPLLLLLVLASGVHAQDRSLFDPPEADAFGPSAAPGARARYAESLAVIQRRLRERPADVVALERALDVAALLDREPLLEGWLRRAREAAKGDEATMRALDPVLAGLLVRRSRGEQTWKMEQKGNTWTFHQELSDAGKKMLKEAIALLRPAVARAPRDARSRIHLAEALERLGVEGAEEEIRRLRMEAAALEEPTPPPEAESGRDLAAESAALVAEALELESREDAPDPGAAVPLRKRALVLEFCAKGIPFPAEYDPALFEPVSLLADDGLIRRVLTRTYVQADGERATVPPVYYPPSDRRRREVIERLARSGTPGAGAVLVSFLRRTSAHEEVAQTALDVLAEARIEHVATHLPALLERALSSRDHRSYPAMGRRMLVALAGRLELRAAAPILVAKLPRDDGLFCPLDVARALGEIGRPEDADALLRIATDVERDVYFRRRAADAFCRVAPGRIAEIEGDRLLSLTYAAARVRQGARDVSLQRILDALAHPHEADDAARHCARLGLREAIPALEQALRRFDRHYARPYIEEALRVLRATGYSDSPR